MKSFLLCSNLLVVGLTVLFLLSCISWGIEAGFAHGFHHSLQCTVSHLRCRRKSFLHRFAMSPMVDDDDDIQHLPSLSSVRPMQRDPSNRRTWMAQTAQQLVSATLGITSASHHSFVAMAATSTTELVPSGAAVLCDSTVSVWQKPSSGRTIYLLGTAHISDVSAQLAGALVRHVHPDAVFVELDVKRVLNLPALHDTATASAQNAAPAVLVPAFQRKVLNFAGAAVGKAVQGMYSNLSNSGFSPGEEFAAAIRAAREIGATIVLGDQDVQVTLRRLAQALSVTDLQPLLNPNAEFEKTMTDLLPLPPALESSNSAAGDPAQFKRDLSDYVERMKSRETVRTIVHELDTVAPAVVRVMLTERDAYMASGLDSLESFKKVVGVMGLAHIDGVEQNLRGRGWTPMHLSCPPK
jgi:TraB/PrgY/gumN family